MRHHPLVSTEVFRFVDASVERALRQASASLTTAGVRHVICGGLAVGAYGYIRATRDADFLVGDEAFIVQGGLVSFVPGVPLKIAGIDTDMVPMEEGMRFLEAEIADPIDFDGMPLISPEGLVAMKLISFRRKDQLDIAELIECGATDYEMCADYLEANGRGDLVERLTRIEQGR